MKKMIALMVVLLGALALSGCAGPSVSVHQMVPGQPYWMTTDAAARGISILPRPDGKGLSMCSEPSPDAMLQSVTQLTAQVQAQSINVDAQTQVQFQTAVVELTQRTTTIVYLREVMYRICEQGMNQSLSPDQTFQLFQMAMQTALKLAEADLAKTQNKTVAALSDPKVQAMWNQLVNGVPTIPASAGGTVVAPPLAPVPQAPSPSPSIKH
jgi:hypothetical protein